MRETRVNRKCGRSREHLDAFTTKESFGQAETAGSEQGALQKGFQRVSLKLFRPALHHFPISKIISNTCEIILKFVLQIIRDPTPAWPLDSLPVLASAAMLFLTGRPRQMPGPFAARFAPGQGA
jgi:hypothetical protein